MIILTATITSKSGKRNEIISKSQDLIKATRSESGCISYELFASTEDEEVLVMFERWENMDALELHNQTEHYMAFGPVIGDFIAKKIQLEVYSVN